MKITEEDFQRLVKFMHGNYGIDLSKKRQLIVGRLSYTIHSMGYANFKDFVDYLLRTKNAELVELVINKLTTNYTFFLREETHFKLLREKIVPEILEKRKRERNFTIWCAGCSSGEEPYTIAMTLHDALGPQIKQWRIQILATDISERALGLAKAGSYALPDDFPGNWKQRYFTADPAKPGQSLVRPEVKSLVSFRSFNLMQPVRFGMQFQVIFCRNVMIYFDQATKDALVKRFCQTQDAGGYLLIGHSETIGRNLGYQFLSPATFQKQ